MSFPDECLLLDLASVIECVDKDTQMRMLHVHESFPDFLLDQSRSGEYYIGFSMVHTAIAQLCLLHIAMHEDYEICTFLAADNLLSPVSPITY